MKIVHFIYLSIIGIIIIAFSFFSTKEENAHIPDEVYESLKADSYNFNQIQNITMEQFRSENTTVDKSTLLFTEKGDSISILELTKKGNRFIIRFNDTGCLSCISFFNNHLHEINDFLETIGTEQSAIIINTNNPRIIRSFKNQHKLTCEVFGLPLGGLSLALETEDSVVAFYFCVLSKEMQIEKCFINIQDWPERTNAYFESIKRKFIK